ncbi:glutathione S-transferase family protein [Rhodoplanes roseus]|uniref:Glutathione S-transferase n=1 Tax=Rhodoplanes roseus TaxID=29409 RepID=A0A327KLT5_9BRAD|nr:glutathione S-transferase family protein [Rhodoplanes roseus]RAI39749.1 glutathione S-transferase [Rhodoplanes roseus]
MLKIWGRTTSSNVQKVMWAIGELGLEHERADLGGPFGGNKEPDYLALNPNGLIPTLQDGNFVLWESNAIVRYLAEVHGPEPLQPADPRSRALAGQWMDWQLTVAAPAIIPVFWQLVRTAPDKRDEAAIATGKEKSIAAFGILDAALAKSAYLAGDTFSYGDIPVAIMARRFLELVTERPSMSNLERWYAAVDLRPAFQQHVASIPMV